ncbi:response regulator transcription factor [Paenarthrobacter sp. NyZ202]|uniref:response regulator transcription factor n=1 Tax=Paenarthrobacter sp. NyZ202 TaxID=3402689 RepID=UPI003CE993EC
MQPRKQSKLQFAAALSRARSIDDLIKELYAGIGSVFDSAAVGFDLLDPGSHRLLSTSAQGVSEFFLARYDSVARNVDPVLKQAIVRRGFAYNLEMMSEKEWQQLEVYREAFSLHRLTTLVYVPIIVSDEVLGTLNIGRVEGKPRFTARELHDVEEVGGLLSSLIGSICLRELLEHEVKMFRDALDMSDEPIVISDAGRAARYMNPAAKKTLERQPSDAPLLDEALLVLQNSRPAPDSIHGFVKRVVSLPGGDGLMAVLRSSGQEDGIPEWLRQSLTARESEVVMLVSKGLRDAEIAQNLHLSVHTVKGYLRQIFKKTGTRSRVELARLAVTEHQK